MKHLNLLMLFMTWLWVLMITGIYISQFEKYIALSLELIKLAIKQ
tara:strand:- start:255 stop:389 length:135 start_codon:yes stop_codon:yes gene_type:complete